MGASRITIGVLTSSRADYGIYRVLLNKLNADTEINLEIICFGMHLIKNQGHTINQVKQDNFGKLHLVGKMPKQDKPIDITKGYGDLINSFATFWNSNKFDFIFSLGDRWEMAAAVQSTIPFQIKVIHIHGGEKSLGSLDNIYRDQITLASSLHFPSSSSHADRIFQLTGKRENIFNIGSLSIEEIQKLELPLWDEVKRDTQLNFDNFILTTFHPETIDNTNKKYIDTIKSSLRTLIEEDNICFLITKGNSDSGGTELNNELLSLQKNYPENVVVISALGKLNYFTAMKKAQLILGNSSSAIIESATFKKWAINVGDRQKGREQNDNVINIPYDTEQIVNTIRKHLNHNEFSGKNKFYKTNGSQVIINEIKNRCKNI